MSLRTFASLACVVAFATAGARAQRLLIGDPAPALKVSRWIKGEPVKSFEPERVYIVEFWATWCIPCRKSIPHLTQLQGKFDKDGVTLIAVSVWEDDQKLVQPFVDKMGDAMNYRVALDEVYEGAKGWQGSMSRAWLKAADEVTIPSAFIVDQRGRIAWIGNSLDIEQPLQQVVDGTWDLGEAKLANQKRVAVNRLYSEFKSYDFRHELSQEEWTKVLATCEELAKLDSGSVYVTGPRRFQGLLTLGREDEGYKLAREWVDGPFKDEALLLNWISWIVVDPDATARKATRKLDFALEVAKRADELTQHENAFILDTLAVCYFETGDPAKALEIQEKAVKLAVGTKWSSELEKRLVKFRDANGKHSEGNKLAVQH